MIDGLTNIFNLAVQYVQQNRLALLFIVSGLLGAFGALLIAEIPFREHLLDEPNARSSHDVPTPRGGGVGILAAFIVGGFTLRIPTTFLFAAILVSTISFYGDYFRISVKFRFIFQFITALMLLFPMLPRLSAHFGFSTFSGFPILFFVILALIVFFLIGTANFYNFMDGINGIAGVSGVIAFGLLGIYTLNNAPPNTLDRAFSMLSLCIAIACLGFLPFNMPRARVFMGDVGSILLGFVFSALVVILSRNYLEVACFAALLFPFYVDELTTMAVRLRDHENLTVAHRRHLYQILANEFAIPHWKVTALYGTVQLTIGIAVLAVCPFGTWPVLVFLGLCFMAFASISARVRLKAENRTPVASEKTKNASSPLHKSHSGERRGSVIATAPRWQPSPLTRAVFFILLDVFIASLSLYLSFLVLFQFNLGIRFPALHAGTFVLFIVIKLLFLGLFGVYKMTWRYAGLSDLVNIFLSLLVAEMLLLTLSFPSAVFTALPVTGIGKPLFLLDGIFSFVMISAVRIAKRVYLEVMTGNRPAARGEDTLIIGAGNAGEMMLRDIIRRNDREFRPIGFLDDDPGKRGASIHNVRVLGKTDDLEAVIRKQDVRAVIIAIPTLNHQLLRKLYDGAKKAGVNTIKIVPRIYDFSQPDINLKKLEDIRIEDLVGRQTVQVDYQGIRSFLRGQTVLITGAGGSIGSEIVNQVCAFDPERVILFDNDETELHNQGLKLRRLYPDVWNRLDFVTGDVRDEARLREVFAKFRPRVVFHAAAYKHVPMMESNPKEAVKVNVFGTFTLANISCDYGVEKFIMISTDKAVRPTSVMGATKRLAEHICRALGENRGENRDSASFPPTRFISVRFGNVLGSRGSVLPLFLDQLKHGGPLTITHPDMKRYFMTIPEAVSLVLQASILGNGGEVFVLDMGEPVRILDVAEELIRLHGLEPYTDIDIEFIGLRPGEKLFEEILTAEEGTDAGCHEKIFIARNGAKYSLTEISAILQSFSEALSDASPNSDEQIKSLLRKYVKHYQENQDTAPTN